MKPREKRSNGQNAWYWGVLIPILSEWSGYERDEMHYVLRGQFLGSDSTAELNTVEFTSYCDRIVRWASQQGVYIPLPGEFTYGEDGSEERRDHQEDHVESEEADFPLPEKKSESHGVE